MVSEENHGSYRGEIKENKIIKMEVKKCSGCTLIINSKHRDKEKKLRRQARGINLKKMKLILLIMLFTMTIVACRHQKSMQYIKNQRRWGRRDSLVKERFPNEVISHNARNSSRKSQRVESLFNLSYNSFQTGNIMINL